MIDLHTHSTASDGSYTPAELISRASEAGITQLALTDHDTVSGLAEARSASIEQGISLIPGIELSARWGTQTLHIVGLGIDPSGDSLRKAITQTQQTRIDRGRTIGKKLEQTGVHNAYLHTCQLAGSELIGRAHFARYLVSLGLAKDFNQVFKRYMVRGKPGYAPAHWMEMDQAVAQIHGSGGIAVLAHPMRYNLGGSKRRKVVEAFAMAGGEAIEVVAGRTNAAEIEIVARLAFEFNLLASVGSDFHGPDKPWVQLGKLPRLPSNCQPVWQQHSFN